MLDNYSFDEVLKWEWASNHPILYTIIEVSPSVITMMIMLTVFKIGSALKSAKKK